MTRSANAGAAPAPAALAAAGGQSSSPPAAVSDDQDASSPDGAVREAAGPKAPRQHGGPAATRDERPVQDVSPARFSAAALPKAADLKTTIAPAALTAAGVGAAGAPGPTLAPGTHTSGDLARPAASPLAAQLGHALAAVHTGADGSSHVSILLDPAELGSLQVRISKGHDGAASVSVTVERPETLRSLQGDLAHLHQALDRAGLPEQRSVSLHLSTADPAPGGQASGSGQQASQGGSQHGTSQERQMPPSLSGPKPVRQDSQPEPVAAWPATARWMRAGVNITA